MALSLYPEVSGINKLRNRWSGDGRSRIKWKKKDIERKGLFEWLSRFAYKGFRCPWFGANIASRPRYN